MERVAGEIDCVELLRSSFPRQDDGDEPKQPMSSLFHLLVPGGR